MPKVSVIIPTHNRSAVLPIAIASVLSQTLQDFEIVVVDDASEDNTREVIDSFSDSRIRYLRHEMAQGPASTRNTGISHAKGDYIAFLDDDDEWFPDKLRMQLNILEKSLPKVQAIYGGSLDVQTENGKVLNQFSPCKRGNIFDDLLIQNWIGPTSTVVINKECFQRVGLFDPSMSYGEDYDMWLRVSKEYDFECIKEPLMKFHFHENGLSKNVEVMIRGREALLRKYGSLFAANSKSYSQHYSDLGVLYVCDGNTTKGREAFLKAIRIYPFQIKPYRNLCLSFLGAEHFKKLRYAREKLTLKLR